MGASCDDSGRAKLDTLIREVLNGAVSEETLARHGILATVQAPPLQLTVPLPPEGTVYQYRFIKEVNLQCVLCYDFFLNSVIYVFFFLKVLWEIQVFYSKIIQYVLFLFFTAINDKSLMKPKLICRIVILT